MESFFSTLKFQLGGCFSSRAAARAELFHYIEVFYNRARMHTWIGDQSPAQFEAAMRRPGQSGQSAVEADALADKDRDVLEAWLRAPSTPQSVATRAGIILLAADGESNSGIADQLGISRPTVIMWRRRFEKAGPVALGQTRPGRGRPRSISRDKIKQMGIISNS